MSPPLQATPFGGGVCPCERFAITTGRDPIGGGVVAPLVGVVFALAGAQVIGGFVLGSISSNDLNAAQHVAVPMFGLALGILWLYVGYRFATIGIYLAHGGLVVRGPYSTRRLTATEVLGVSVAEWQPPLGRPAAAPVIELADRSKVAVWSLNARSLLILGGDGPDGVVEGLRRALGLDDG